MCLSMCEYRSGPKRGLPKYDSSFTGDRESTSASLPAIASWNACLVLRELP